MQAALGVWVRAKDSQCRVTANVTSEKAGKELPVSLICFLLLGRSLDKKLSSQNVTDVCGWVSPEKPGLLYVYFLNDR